jgi:putative cell wall-binding protein
VGVLIEEEMIMATFNLTPEQFSAYKKSLSGMTKTKRKLKRVINYNKESPTVIDSEYKLELLNVIEGYMRIVLKNSDQRLSFRNRP